MAMRYIHKWPDTIEELLDSHLVKKPMAALDDEMAEVDACYGHPSSPITLLFTSPYYLRPHLIPCYHCH